MIKLVAPALAVVLMMAGCVDDGKMNEKEAEAYHAAYNEGYEDGMTDEEMWGTSGFNRGYEAAVSEFCFEGDAQSGGWYEGYDQGKEDYRKAIFDDENTKDKGEFFYDFFERYCEDDTFAEYVDSTCAGWREYMPKGRGLR